jgi:hypothetical protein
MSQVYNPESTMAEIGGWSWRRGRSARRRARPQRGGQLLNRQLNELKEQMQHLRARLP